MAKERIAENVQSEKVQTIKPPDFSTTLPVPTSLQFLVRQYLQEVVGITDEYSLSHAERIAFERLGQHKHKQNGRPLEPISWFSGDSVVTVQKGRLSVQAPNGENVLSGAKMKIEKVDPPSNVEIMKQIDQFLDFIAEEIFRDMSLDKILDAGTRESDQFTSARGHSIGFVAGGMSLRHTKTDKDEDGYVRGSRTEEGFDPKAGFFANAAESITTLLKETIDIYTIKRLSSDGYYQIGMEEILRKAVAGRFQRFLQDKEGNAHYVQELTTWIDSMLSDNHIGYKKIPNPSPYRGGGIPPYVTRRADVQNNIDYTIKRLYDLLKGRDYGGRRCGDEVGIRRESYEGLREIVAATGNLDWVFKFIEGFEGGFGKDENDNPCCESSESLYPDSKRTECLKQNFPHLEQDMETTEDMDLLYRSACHLQSDKKIIRKITDRLLASECKDAELFHSFACIPAIRNNKTIMGKIINRLFELGHKKTIVSMATDWKRSDSKKEEMALAFILKHFGEFSGRDSGCSLYRLLLSTEEHIDLGVQQRVLDAAAENGEFNTLDEARKSDHTRIEMRHAAAKLLEDHIEEIDDEDILSTIGAFGLDAEKRLRAVNKMKEKKFKSGLRFVVRGGEGTHAHKYKNEQVQTVATVALKQIEEEEMEEPCRAVKEIIKKMPFFFLPAGSTFPPDSITSIDNFIKGRKLENYLQSKLREVAILAINGEDGNENGIRSRLREMATTVIMELLEERPEMEKVKYDTKRKVIDVLLKQYEEQGRFE